MATRPTVVVDREICIGSGMCVMYASSTFTQDDEAKAVVADQSGDDAETINAAVDACPTGALTLSDQTAPNQAGE